MFAECAAFTSPRASTALHLSQLPRTAVSCLCSSCHVFSQVVLKLLGLGFGGYFRDVWHVFDFFVTIAAIVSRPASFSG